MLLVLSAITRKQYKQFLKKCYRQSLPDDDKLLITASKHYIRLAIISKEDVTSKQEKEFTKKSVYGLTGEILRKKIPIELKHILKPGEDGTVPRCILVEGAPGIGKSTLAWEVCHKWEELESIKHYELVVLVRLRERKAQEAGCLGDLLPCDATTNMKELLAAIGEGEGMLVICDGFDELPRERRQEGSVYIDLLKSRLLPEATVIVTSRPSVSADLWSSCQHNIDRHLEVIGFTKEDIKQFAQSVFKGDILEGFLSYITSNPPIHSMMYIPLNAVIVALIYQDNYNTDTPFPTTMTQLFDSFTRALIRRHLVSTYKVPSDYCMPPSLQCLDDICKLPRVVVRQLLQLAKVACDSLSEKKIVFSDLGENFEHLGTMKKTTSLNVCIGPGCSYSFLHLTLQEYLAALHVVAIANLKCYEIELEPQSLFMRFLAGLCRHDVYHRSPFYHQLVETLSDNSFNGTTLVNCAYECPEIMDNIKKTMGCSKFKHAKIGIEPEVGFDWYATGYCISHFDRRWKLVIRNEFFGEEEIDLLVKGLRSAPIAKGRIHYLSIWCLAMEHLFLSLREFFQLCKLQLFGVNIGHEDLVILRQLIAPGSTLKKLKFSYGQQFIPFLFEQSSLLSLNQSPLPYVNISTEFLPHMNTNLKKLSISRNVLHSLYAADFIGNITSLTCLKIDDVLDSDLPVLANIVQSHRTLEVLNVVNRLDSDTVRVPTNMVKLIEALAGNSRFKKLKIWGSDYRRLPPHIRERYDHILKPKQSAIEKIYDDDMFTHRLTLHKIKNMMDSMGSKGFFDSTSGECIEFQVMISQTDTDDSAAALFERQSIVKMRCLL